MYAIVAEWLAELEVSERRKIKLVKILVFINANFFFNVGTYFMTTCAT